MNQRLSRIGALCWIATVQFFVFAHAIAGYTTPRYDGRRQVLSDLGSTRCILPAASHRLFCSPGHDFFALTLLIQGSCMIAGSLLLGPLILSRVVRSCFVVAGAALFGIAAFPENGLASVHVAFASLHCAALSIGLLWLGFSRSGYSGRPVGSRPTSIRSTIIRVSAAVCGIVSAGASLALLQPSMLMEYAGLIERFAVFPFPLVLIELGVLNAIQDQTMRVVSAPP